MPSRLSFPTRLHEQVAELTRGFFAARPHVDTVLLVNSCAHGQALPESDLDMAVLVTPAAAPRDVHALETPWRDFTAAHPLVRAFRQTSAFAHLHVDVFDGRFTPPPAWDEGGGPDRFELEVGNRIAYAAPLHGAGRYFHELQARWLPYYGSDLRLERLAMVRRACAYDLNGASTDSLGPRSRERRARGQG